MLKCLVIFAVLVVATALSPGQEKNRSGLPQNQKDNQSAPAVSFVHNETSAPNAQSANTEQPPWWKRPEWWLCILGVPTLGALLWQAQQTKLAAIATKEAAKAGLDSANAARLNAQALVNSERPWLIAETVKNSQMPHFHEIQITNCGRTPARFISGDAAYDFVERPDLLPVPPIYSSPFTIPKQVLIATGRGFPIPHGYNIPHLLEMPQAANKTLVVYGRNIYEDTIIPDVAHETRWCFGYVPADRGQITQLLPPALQALANEIQIPAHTMGGDFVLTGPNDYTKHT